MVTTYSEFVTTSSGQPRFIYICGCDGTGKSTQAQHLLARLSTTGQQPRHLWLRFPFFLSLPLLAYARWQGYSRYEDFDGIRHGYWDFHRSRLLRIFLPWTYFVDALLAAGVKIYLPLWLGQTIVCERFVLDMLVDLAVALDDKNLHQRLPGRLYSRLLPRKTAIFILDLDAETIRDRRPDLQVDRRLESRLQAFRRLAASQGATVISSRLPMPEITQYIWETIRR